MLELGVLTALVVALAGALYFLRPHQRSDPQLEPSDGTQGRDGSEPVSQDLARSGA